MKAFLTTIFVIIGSVAFSQTAIVSYTSPYDDHFETFTSTSIPIGQTFTVPNGTDYSLEYVSIRAYSYDGGSYGTLTASIYLADGSGYPTGSPLATGTMGSGMGTSYPGTWYNINMTSYTLQQNVRYVLVLTTTGYTVQWVADVIGSYIGENAVRYMSGAWSNTLDGNGVDFLFEVYGTAGSAPPPSGGGQKVVQSTGAKSILLDGVAYNVLLGTGSLPPIVGGTGSIFDLNEAINPGINAYGISLSSWDDSYYADIAALGFKSVRLVSYHTIDASGMAGVKHAVDMALAAGLIPIYGPWDPAFKVDNSAANQDEFVDWMDYISDYFKDYAPNQFILEFTNEPENLTRDAWNTLVARCLTAIRANDPDRPVMISPQYWGQVPGLDGFEPPADTMTIISVHLYRPETFVWQGVSKYRADEWVGTEWYPLPAFTDMVDQWFAPMITWSAAHPQYAMNVGEFGATKNADNASRARFMNYHARYFESQGWSWALWDYYNDYGIRYPETTDSTSTMLVNALISDPAPSPTPQTATTIYQSNFSTTVGWSASTDVSLTASGGNLVATATSASSNYEDRYIYKTFNLQQFHHYRLTLLLQSTRSTAVVTWGGPYVWELISGITASPYWKSYVYTFTFSWYDDSAAMLKLCIGGSGTTTLYVGGVLVEEISVTP